MHEPGKPGKFLGVLLIKKLIKLRHPKSKKRVWDLEFFFGVCFLVVFRGLGLRPEEEISSSEFRGAIGSSGF